MNKFIYMAVALALGCSSCSDFLDKAPDNRTELTTEKSIQKLMVSAYPKTTPALIGEFYSDNVDENSRQYSYWGKVEQELYNWKDGYEEDQDSPTSLWNDCYLAIASANNVLQAIDKQGNPASLQPYKGEALICRAYAHFLLATTFCKQYNPATADSDLGIEYVTEPETSVSPAYHRGTVAETYKKMAEDIEAGLPLISDEAYTVPKYHFNQKAAYAFAARFYLNYMQTDFSNCRKVVEYATKVVGSNPSEYLRDWKTLGSLSRNGDVQPNAYVDTSSPANLMLISSSSYLGGTVDAGWNMGARYAHNAVTALEDCGSNGLWGGSTAFYQQKFQPGSGSPKMSFRRVTLYRQVSISGDTFYPYVILPVFTTDETLITRAEAYALLKEYDNAVADINAWQAAFTSTGKTVTLQSIEDYYGTMAYWKANAPTVKKELHPDFTIDKTQESLIDCVLHIRRILTLGEGQRWLDIKRYGITVERRYFENGRLMAITDKMDKDDPRRAVQIPHSVIAAGVEANPR